MHLLLVIFIMSKNIFRFQIFVKVKIAIFSLDEKRKGVNRLVKVVRRRILKRHYLPKEPVFPPLFLLLFLFLFLLHHFLFFSPMPFPPGSRDEGEKGERRKKKEKKRKKKYKPNSGHAIENPCKFYQKSGNIHGGGGYQQGALERWKGEEG